MIGNTPCAAGDCRAAAAPLRAWARPHIGLAHPVPTHAPSCRSATDGCPSGNGFRVTVPLQANSWHYIIVGHTSSGAAPLTKLTVALN